jgi:hypothetical protein
MLNKEEICKKITEIYPDIGACGIEVLVDYDKAMNSWVVDLKKDGHELKTYIQPEEAQDCLAGKQCVSLGLEIAQLRKTIEQLHSSSRYGD